MPLTHEQANGLRKQLDVAGRAISLLDFYAIPPMGEYDLQAVVENLGDAVKAMQGVLAGLVEAMAEPPASTPHEFVLRIPSASAFDDEIEEVLYAAGIGDGTMSWREGVLRIRFTRLAPTRDEAIRSAIEDVRRAGIEAVLEEQQ